MIKKENMKDLEQYWPLQWLRKVTHIPHIYDGWIEEGVILPNGEPPQPFAPNTGLSSIMVCKPKEIGLENVHINQEDIKVYTLIPIYEEERNLALEKGHEYVVNKMVKKGVTDALDINRTNVGKV